MKADWGFFVIIASDLKLETAVPMRDGQCENENIVFTIKISTIKTKFTEK